MTQHEARFHVGQIVTHLRWGYRGVIYDVDPVFSSSEEWYETMARSRPPRDRPWYHVLVDGETHTTYVAERHLAADDSAAPIRHPLIDELFSGLKGGRYVRRAAQN